MWKLVAGAALLGLVACAQKAPEAEAPVPPKIQEVAPPVEPPPASPPSYHRLHVTHHRKQHHKYRRHIVHHHNSGGIDMPPADSPPK